MALLTFNTLSKTIGSNMNVRIIMPTTELAVGEKYKVLYLLHGGTGDESDWTRFTNIEAYVEQYNVAVIMPNARNSFYHDMAYGNDFYTYITNELMPQMEQMFPIRNDRQGRSIAGLSMGGYGSLYIGLNNCDKFSKIASLSGAVELSMIKDLMKEYSQNQIERDLMFKVFGNIDPINTTADIRVLVEQQINNLPGLYIACGDQDFVFGLNQSFNNYLNELDVDHYYEETPGYKHHWDYWDLKIQDVLKWLYKE